MTRDEIINKMIDEMPFSFSEQLRPYVKEAMTIYAKQEVKKLNIPDVSKSVCKHEWIMTADSFDQTCYCKKCGKSS